MLSLAADTQPAHDWTHGYATAGRGWLLDDPGQNCAKSQPDPDGMITCTAEQMEVTGLVVKWEGKHRPIALVALAEGEAFPGRADERTAIYRIPRGTKPRAVMVAREACALVTARLKACKPLMECFRTVAFGADQIQIRLAARHVHRDRKTIRTDLAHLFGEPVGQMDHFFDLKAVKYKTGAFMYRIQIEYRAVAGDLVAKAMRVIDALSTDCGSFGGKAHGRVAGALQWALRTSKPGNRNDIGHRLAALCQEHIGLNEDEIRTVMFKYRAQLSACTPPGASEYEAKEVTNTLRSVFKHKGSRAAPTIEELEELEDLEERGRLAREERTRREGPPPDWCPF